jgi:1-deoxy-D-xylulose-5-phosphate reductoisomerase
VRDIVILGSTGSIGVQALELVAANSDLFRVVGISAGSGNLELLFQQARTFRVPIVGTTAPRELWEKFAGGVAVIDGALASAEIAAISCDIVLNGITGSIGLSPTLSALAAGNKVALANKESLVAGGPLVTAFGRNRIIPVDSEHSALFQALLAGKRSEVKKFVITASGGAFRDRADLSGVTLAEALVHPTWSMGPVVTINSATLMNKGLEVIEAHYLFDLPYSQIEAVIHPQSVIHSMVEYIDGSTIAQLSPPNMKGPIGYALNFPDRLKRSTAPVDLEHCSFMGFCTHRPP